MRNVLSSPPVVVGGTLVIPAGLLKENPTEDFSVDADARRRIERLAMQAVIEAERAIGYETKDVSHEKCGWDITSLLPMKEGRLSEPGTSR